MCLHLAVRNAVIQGVSLDHKIPCGGADVERPALRSVISVQGNDAVIGRRLTAVHIPEQEGISYHHSGRESVPNMSAPELFPLLFVELIRKNVDSKVGC
jgi:hypothetical protein